MSISRAALGSLLGALLAFTGPVQALEAPTGPVILKVSGKLAHANVGDEAHFDRAMLHSLEQHETVTNTPWYDSRVSFEGPLGRALLEAVGAEGDSLRIRALNDYAASVPVEDFMAHDVILAMSADGRPLRVRDHGPLFVIYPFDDKPELLNEEILFRSVWQVNRIEIE
nr:molybdopterin-dependent oxidoreductase [Halomonas ilicicola]